LAEAPKRNLKGITRADYAAQEFVTYGDVDKGIKAKLDKEGEKDGRNVQREKGDKWRLFGY